MPTVSTFQVRANSVQVPVYSTAPFLVCSFAFSGTVQLAVSSISPFSNVTIYPSSLGLKPVITGKNTFTLALTKPAKFQVVLDGRIDAIKDAGSILYVFADAPETDVPRPGDPGVYYVDNKMVHTVPGGVLEITSNITSIYLEPGSQLNATIHMYAIQDFRIYGRGTIVNPLPKIAGQGKCTLYIGGSASHNVTVQDVNFFGSPWWQIHLSGGANHTIDNIKMLASSANTDGITFTDSAHGHVVHNSFILNNDNTLVFGSGLATHPGAYNNTIVGTTFLKHSVGSWLFLQGGGQPTTIGPNNTVRDCDIVRTMHEPALVTNWLGYVSTIGNFVIDDVRIESFALPSAPANYTPVCNAASLTDGLHSNCLLYLAHQAYDYPKALTFKNMDLPTSQASYIAGGNWTVTFSNVSVAGKRVASDADLRITKGNGVQTVYL